MFKFLNKKTNNLASSISLIAIFTLLAQILAIVRNKIFATEFGASKILDIYNTAFKIPDLVFLLIGMMVSGSILIPFLIEKEKINKKKYILFISQIFSSFSLFSIIIATLLFFLMPFLIPLFFPGFTGIDQEQLIKTSQFMLMSPIFMSIANIFIAINQKNNTFIPIALTGVFYNILIISSIYLFYPYFGMDGLTFGVIIGSAFYFLLQLPSIFKQNLFPKKISFLSLTETKKYLSKSIPRSLALFISTLIPIFLYSQASKMPTGSITILQFALSLYMVPVILITSSYNIASFTRLAEYFANKQITLFSNFVSQIISNLLFFIIPISFFFFSFSLEINGLLFGSQKFNITHLKSISLILSIFSFLIVIQSLIMTISRVLYATKNTIVIMITNSIFLFSVLFCYYSLDYFNYNSIFTISFAFTFGSILALIFLLIIIKIKMKNYFNIKKIFIIKKLIISFFAMLISRFIIGLPNFNYQETFWQYFFQLIFGSIIFIIIFILFAKLLKEPNFLSLEQKITNYFKKDKIN